MNRHPEHRARKRFGQNFLHDANIINRIVDAAVPDPGSTLVEIGPGKGALTELLLDRYDTLTAVEVDRDLAAGLRAAFITNPGFSLINADILKTELSELAEPDAALSIVGNLPYNISTPLIFRLLQHHDRIRKMVFMLQLEVVDRMCAKPGDDSYGRLSIMVQYYCQVEKLFLVSPSCFNPVPKVWSAVVSLTPWQTLPDPAHDEALFARIVREAFNQRRKTLRNSLKQLISPEQLDTLGIDSSQRPEALALQDYVSISNALSR